MTAALQIDAIMTAVAAVSVSGWTISSLSNIPEMGDTRSNAILFPDAGNLLTGLEIHDVSFGDTAAAKDASYTLNYIFAYQRVEAGRTISEYLPAMVAAVQDLLEALATTFFAGDGAIELQPYDLSMGVVQDPAGSSFFGGTLKLRVTEFVQ